MDKFTAFIKVVKKDFTFITFWLSFIGLILGVFFKEPISSLISSVLLFSAYDSFGFYYATTHYQTTSADDQYFEWLAAYRNMQVFTQIAIILLLASFSIPASIAFITLWWFGLCDLIYYLLLKQKVSQFKDMNWLKWTIWGIFTKNITGKKLILWSIISILLIIAYGVLYRL